MLRCKKASCKRHADHLRRHLRGSVLAAWECVLATICAHLQRARVAAESTQVAANINLQPVMIINDRTSADASSCVSYDMLYGVDGWGRVPGLFERDLLPTMSHNSHVQDSF